MLGVTTASGSRVPVPTTSRTCTIVVVAAVAITGAKLRAVLRYMRFPIPSERCAAIASNDSYSGWTNTFTDPRLCAAMIDRLTFGGHIIETGTDSYRLAQDPRQTTLRPQKSTTPTPCGFGVVLRSHDDPLHSHA